jgi:hypothetical protein
VKRATPVASAAWFATVLAGCDQRPVTTVTIDNDYPPSATPLVVYRAYWQAVAFQNPIPPGGSSDAQSTVAASDNTAYVVLAPGWDADSSVSPTSFVLMQSRSGFSVDLNGALHIPVDDSTFIGNCASGSPLSQEQADFIAERIFTQTIFPDAAAPFTYDAVNCTTTPVVDAGAH